MATNDDIRMAQVEAGEKTVVERLRKKGLLPRHDPRTELGIMVVCNACGSIVDASWVNPDGTRQAVIVVEKCLCDSPLMKEACDDSDN